MWCCVCCVRTKLVSTQAQPRTLCYPIDTLQFWPMAFLDVDLWWNENQKASGELCKAVQLENYEYKLM